MKPGNPASDLLTAPDSGKSGPAIPIAGEIFEHPYPFVHSSYTEWDEDGSAEVPCWKPGVTMKETYEDYVAYADGMGEQILTVVATYKPGRFPTRVFFTRRWRNPSGGEFGKGALRIATVQAFRSLTSGYRHDFELDEVPLPTRVIPKSNAEVSKGLPVR